MSDERPSPVSTPQTRVAPVRRTASALGTSLPVPMRRTPQSVRRTPSVPAAVSGPLGAYRNLSRTHSTPRRADAAHDAAGLGKRSFSSTGLPDTPAHATPRETPKRTPLPPAAAESPSGASYELTMLRTEYDRRLAEEQRAYKQFESQLRTQSRELEALKHQRAEAAREWEAERAAQRAKEDAWAHTQRTLEAQLAQLRAESLQHQDTTHTLRAALRDAESRAQTRQSELQAELIDARSDAEQARADAAQARAHAAELERAAAERAAPEAPPAAPAADEAVDALKAELSRTLPTSRRTHHRCRAPRGGTPAAYGRQRAAHGRVRADRDPARGEPRPGGQGAAYGCAAARAPAQGRCGACARGAACTVVRGCG